MLPCIPITERIQHPSSSQDEKCIWESHVAGNSFRKAFYSFALVFSWWYGKILRSNGEDRFGTGEIFGFSYKECKPAIPPGTSHSRVEPWPHCGCPLSSSSLHFWHHAAGKVIRRHIGDKGRRGRLLFLWERFSSHPRHHGHHSMIAAIRDELQNPGAHRRHCALSAGAYQPPRGFRHAFTRIKNSQASSA